MFNNVNLFSNLTPAQIKKYDLDGDGKLSDTEKEAAQSNIEQESPQSNGTTTNELPLDYKYGVVISSYSETGEEKTVYDMPSEARKAFNTMKESFIETYIKGLQEDSSLSDNERKSLISFINSKSAAFIDQWMKKNTSGPYNMEEISSAYLENINTLLTERQEQSAAVKEKMNALKNNTVSLEQLAGTIEKADADYMTDTEFEEIKGQTIDYIMGNLLNGEDISAFLSGINPNYKSNQNYKIALSCLEAMQTEADPAKAQSYLERAEQYFGSFLGTKAEDGTSTFTNAISAQNLAIVKKEMVSQIDVINDRLNEQYFDGMTKTGEEYTDEDIATRQQKYENIKTAFLAQYEGDGTDVEQAYNAFVEEVEAASKEIELLIQGASDKDTYQALKDAVENAGSYTNLEEKDNILNAAVDYALTVLLNGEEDTAFLSSMFPEYKTNSKYVLAKQLLGGLETSATPKEDFEQVQQLLSEMKDSMSASAVVIALDKEDARLAQVQKDEYSKQLDSTIDKLLEDYSNETKTIERKSLLKRKREREVLAHSAEDVGVYSQKLQNIRTAFLEQYQGDGTDLEDSFIEYVNKINSETDTVMADLDAKTTESTYNSLADAVQATGNYMSADEKEGIVKFGVDYVLSLMKDSEEGTFLSAVNPSYATNGKYVLAKQLFDGLETSATPTEDYEQIRTLLNEMFSSIKAETIHSVVNTMIEEKAEEEKIEASKNVNITISQVTEGGLFGYNNKDTHGDDDDVYTEFKITDGQIEWTHGNDAPDINKTMSQMLDKIKDILKEQLGDLYNDEMINNIFNQAQIDAMLEMENPRGLHNVSELVDAVLNKFNPLMRDALHEEKGMSTIEANYGDTSITNGIEEFFGEDDRFYYKDTAKDPEDGHVYLNNSDNGDYQNIMNELYSRLVDKYKAALGDEFDEESFKKSFQSAQWNALEVMKGNKELAWGGSCKGDKHKNSFNVVVNQTLYELDKLIQNW